jgi:ABC-type lipoprotein release transport system permease subunit
MVAALNIVASLVLLVMEKSRDIAILKTMGSSAASIRRIFMLQGLVIGLVGTAVGATLGVVISTALDRTRAIRIPSAVHRGAKRRRARRARGDRDLLPRHDLPVEAGSAARPRRGAPP